MFVIMKRQNSNDGSVEMIVENMRNKACVVVNNKRLGLGGQGWDKFIGCKGPLLRWGCRGSIPDNHKPHITNILNTAVDIKKTVDKPRFRVQAYKEGLKTLPIYPFDDGNVWGYNPNTEFVLRKNNHERGSTFIKGPLRTLEPTYDLLLCEGVGCYLQPYVEKVAEFRVNFVQGRCVQVLERKLTPNMDKEGPWNEANTVNVKWGEWNLEIVHGCLEVAKYSGLYCGSIDVIVEEGTGCYYILEVNTAPELTPYQAKCFARAFDWSVESNNYDFLAYDVESYDNYRELIHPVLI